MLSQIVLIALIGPALGLVCTQIPIDRIHDNGEIDWPGPRPMAIPPNFNCVYTIPTPATDSQVIYGILGVDQELTDANDKIIVTDFLGKSTVIQKNSVQFTDFDLFPGTNTTVQVLGGSGLTSKFTMIMRFHQAKPTMTRKMRSGGSLNFVDLSTLDGQSERTTSSVSISGNEQLSVTLASKRYDPPIVSPYIYNAYLIDGDFLHQRRVIRLSDLLDYSAFTTTSTMVTVVNFQQATQRDVAVVVNPVSETMPFLQLNSAVSTVGDWNAVRMDAAMVGVVVATEVVATSARQITMSGLKFNMPVSQCQAAQIITGPPNNSSQLLMDFTKNTPRMPYTFNLQYFTVISKDCDFDFSVSTFE